MHYVEVIGESHAEALDRLRKEHGPNTLIVEEYSKPAEGFFSRMRGGKQFIIKAMIREKQVQPVKEVRAETRHPAQPVRAPAKSRDDISEFLRKLESLDIVPSEQKSPRMVPGKSLREEPAQGMEKLAKDIELIKETIVSGTVSPRHNESDFARLERKLVEQDFSPEWVQDFIGELKNSIPRNEWSNPSRIYVHARELLSNKIRTNSVLGARRIIALIGPTGVGKTTTLAKIAARLTFREHRRISLITLDNFRIAATEQLKIYGEIMNIPVQVAHDEEEFNAKVKSERAEIILVDNTGLSQNNDSAMETQKEYFRELGPDMEKYLTVSATSKPRDLKSVFNRFAGYGIDRVIITKTDETMTLGAPVELAMRYNLPIAFLTNGQNVPDNIREADRKEIATLLLSTYSTDQSE